MTSLATSMTQNLEGPKNEPQEEYDDDYPEIDFDDASNWR
jgi:hypothetical protein